MRGSFSYWCSLRPDISRPVSYLKSGASIDLLERKHVASPLDLCLRTNDTLARCFCPVLPGGHASSRMFGRLGRDVQSAPAAQCADVHRGIRALPGTASNVPDRSMACEPEFQPALAGSQP